jgi:hypothetical protein
MLMSNSRRLTAAGDGFSKVFFMDRGFQALLMISTAGLSWLLMMVLHEAGHVLHGWLSSAQIAEIHLPLLGFSRTDFIVNPHPLFVAWGGAVWGCLLPLAILAVVYYAVRNYSYLARWFAGFCLIANGAYLAAGSFYKSGADDAGVIMQAGGAQWQLLLSGIPTVILGIYFWNGLGPQFGLGVANYKVDRKVTIGITAALLIIAILEIIVSHR